MKFFGGFITGVLATILVLVLIWAVDQSDRTFELDDTLLGLTMFPEKGECIATEFERTTFESLRSVTTIENELVVFQVLPPNMALAMSNHRSGSIVVLVINYDGQSFFDRQRIQIPSNKCARQVGIYRYITEVGRTMTVPAVVIGYR